MTLQISLPLGDKQNVKNLVFTILTREYPLKLIQLTNFIRKRYGRAVTFQAVRKATLELVKEEVLIRLSNEFSINKDMGSKGAKLSIVSEINSHHFSQFIDISELKQKLKNI